MSAPVRLHRGSLHLPRPLCDRHLPGVVSVVLLRDGRDLVLLPVSDAAAGGLLLKVRNAAGDRVVDAADLLRAHEAELPGLSTLELTPPWRWDEARARLVIPGLFPAGRGLTVLQT